MTVDFKETKRKNCLIKYMFLCFIFCFIFYFWHLRLLGYKINKKKKLLVSCNEFYIKILSVCVYIYIYNIMNLCIFV